MYWKGNLLLIKYKSFRMAYMYLSQDLSNILLIFNDEIIIKLKFQNTSFYNSLRPYSLIELQHN